MSKDYTPGKPLAPEKKEQMIAEGRMAQKELDDAKAAYAKGDYTKAAGELADAAKYSVQHGVDAVKGSTSTSKEGSSTSGHSATAPRS